MTWPKTDADHLLVTAPQMANLESEMFASGLPVAALMEKVGQAMAAWLISHSGLIDSGVVVLVGPGHNGGDGLVVARELYLAGVKVEIWCPLNVNKTLTAQHLSHANWLGIRQLKQTPNTSDKSLWIDALFGLSQSRPLPQPIVELFNKRHLAMPGRMVSLDVPSGICPDSGEPFAGGAAFASFTLTVGLIKQGLVQDLALPYVGRLVRIELGLQTHVLHELPKPLRLCIKPSDLMSVSWPQPDRLASKYQRGRVLVIAGSDQYRGAALLALKGVMATGVGSIQAAIPKKVADSLWQVLPEVVVAGVLQSPSKGALLCDFLAAQDLGRFDAVLLGPGLGASDEHWREVIDSFQDFDGLIVLDADGLNRLASFEGRWEWIQRRNGVTWLTPHLSEFQRLFPDIETSSLLDAACAAAQLSGAGVLLKAANSVIADPLGMAWQLVDTAPYVARTGLGDLLAGFVTGAGALSIASPNGISCEVLAMSAFVHAQMARESKKGSSASAVLASLEEWVKIIQSKDLDLDILPSSK
ncbi:NAD(P)H-hydrate dehydratase [Prochlorococcus sp. MIT 1307]|uniref:NAD(P)H-hydrate dehydratase n=1 Tax=Prochlorococcus sp. MIT 1307 TaxID=3096219 RepID=UPI002A75ADBC|nr:NAD(P)H-hydrate dehydratase [Prochlorococcus sp. MIT 1307]